MDFEKYTERSRGFIQSAQSLALREGHQRFAPEHLLKVLLDDEEGLAAGLIKASGGDSRLALSETEATLKKMPKVSGGGAGQVYLAPEMARIFDTAQKLAETSGDSYVSAERLLQALAVEQSEAAKALKSAGVTAQGLNQAINAILLQYDDGLFLAAVVGEVAQEENGFDFPIETREGLRANLRRVHELVTAEIDDYLSRELLDFWSERIEDLVLPITGPLDFSKKVLLKVRVWRILDNSSSSNFRDTSPGDTSPDFTFPPRKQTLTPI